MNEIKFTQDGKKVIVLGDFNENEKIVQEIYIDNGVEKPFGPKFIAKDLHDSTILSWKETELKKLNETFESNRDRYNQRISELKEQFISESSLLKQHLEYIGKALKNANEKSFETLVAYLTGRIKYILVPDGMWERIYTFEEFFKKFNNKDLKLISIFGDDSGNLLYKENTYKDGSGNYNTFIPFETLEEAIVELTKILNNETVNERTFSMAVKYNIKLDEEQLRKYKERVTEEANNNIKKYEDEIKKYRNIIEKL